MPTSVVATRAELHAVWPDLEDVAIVGIDLRDSDLDWSAAQLRATIFMGCRLPRGAIDRLIARGAVVMSAFDRLPFEPHRAGLYTYDELMRGHETTARATLDTRIGAWFAESSTSLHDAIVRAIHDATIDAAVAHYTVGRRVVGVMGGHAVSRDADLYRRVAELGRALRRAGYTVATGGGPGVMEAANLTNSIREDGLLAIARSGVVFAPGGAGTEQEIFTDTAQNSLTLYEVRSPMVFFGVEFFEVQHPELLAAVRHQSEAFGWSALIAVCDAPDNAVAFIRKHDPDALGREGIERRRTHQDA